MGCAHMLPLQSRMLVVGQSLRSSAALLEAMENTLHLSLRVESLPLAWREGA